MQPVSFFAGCWFHQLMLVKETPGANSLHWCNQFALLCFIAFQKTANLPLLNKSAFIQVIGFIEVNLCFSWPPLFTGATNLPKWKQSLILMVENEAFQPICLILQFFNPWLWEIRLINQKSVLIKVVALVALHCLKSNQLKGKFQPISVLVGPCSYIVCKQSNSICGRYVLCTW